MDPSQVNSVMKLDPGSDSENKYPRLHAMGFGELLDTTFSLYRRHFRSFLAIASCACLAMFLMISVVFFDDSVGRGAKVAIWIPTIVVFLGVSVFVVSGLMCASTEVYLGRSIRIRAVLRRAGHRFLRCFIGSLSFAVLAVLLIFFSIVLLAAVFRPFLGNSPDFVDLPSIFASIAILLVTIFVTGWFVTYWCFFAAAVLVEGRSVSDSLGRRRELIREDWWRIIGAMFAIFLLQFAIGFIFRIVFGFLLSFTGFVDVMEFLKRTNLTALWQLLTRQPEMSSSYILIFLVNLGVDIVTMPIWVIGGTLLYFNQRIRKEAFDIEMMAAHQGG